MIPIGGNVTAAFQIQTSTENEIHEYVQSWEDALSVKGWLDLTSDGGRGDSQRTTFNAKIQESTHIFICDYCDLSSAGITAENARLVVSSKVYDILMIDNPMEMGEHLEIYLKFVGGEQNVD